MFYGELITTLFKTESCIILYQFTTVRRRVTLMSAVLHLCTWVHLIAVNVGAAVAATDTSEGGNGVPVAVTVTEKETGC